MPSLSESALLGSTLHELGQQDMMRETSEILSKYRYLLDKLMNLAQVSILVSKVGVRGLEGLRLLLEEGAELFHVLIAHFGVEGVGIVQGDGRHPLLPGSRGRSGRSGLILVAFWRLNHRGIDVDQTAVNTKDFIKQSLVRQRSQHRRYHVDLSIKDHHGIDLRGRWR